MAETPSTSTNSDDDGYSASATLIHFPHPIPLLRRPMPTDPADDPNMGPYVLAFPSPQSFFTSRKQCQSKLLEQCESGMRIGCSITASNKCKPPWWKTFFGKIDFKERSDCEEREMSACLQGSAEKCANFANEKCVGPFGWARVCCRKTKLRKKEVGMLISWVSGLGFLNGNMGFQMLISNQLGLLLSELNFTYEVNYVRGCELLGDNNQPK